MCSDYNALDILAKVINGSLIVVEEIAVPILHSGPVKEIDLSLTSKNSGETVKNEETIILHNSKITELTQELSSHQEENQSLKSQLEEFKQRIDGLQNEKVSLVAKLESIQAQLEIFQKKEDGSQNDDVQLFSAWYTEKVEELSFQLQTAKSQAEYYKLECESLLKRTLFTLELNSELEQKINDGETKKCRT